MMKEDQKIEALIKDYMRLTNEVKEIMKEISAIANSMICIPKDIPGSQ